MSGSCYLESTVKSQKWICRTDGPSIAASLEHFDNCQNIASISLFYRFVHLNWLNKFLFLIVARGLLVFLIDRIIFL